MQMSCSHRVIWRRYVCCQEKTNKGQRMAYFPAFYEVGISEALRKARLSCMETHLLFSLTTEKVDGLEIAVVFSL